MSPRDNHIVTLVSFLPLYKAADKTLYSAGIDFSRQNLTSIDVNPRTVIVILFIIALDPYLTYMYITYVFK